MNARDMADLVAALNPAAPVVASAAQVQAAMRIIAADTSDDTLILRTELRLWPDSPVWAMPTLPAGCTALVTAGRPLTDRERGYLERWAQVK